MIYNLIREDCLDDRDSLFNEYDNITVFPRTITKWEELTVFIGLMPSLTQSRSNGWAGDLPTGWIERLTKKHRLYIWNPKYTLKEWEEIYPKLHPEDVEQARNDL